MSLLCSRAVEPLDGAQILGGRSPLVLTHRGGKPHGRQLRRKLQIAAVPHGFRSSFLDWAAERTNHPREAVGGALAHTARNQAEAREQALANRKLARTGGDPLAEKRRSVGIPTFAEAARRVVEQKRAGWRSRAQGRDWMLTFERYAFPRVGKVPVSEVTSADMLEILAPIWHEKAATARKLRQRLHAVLEWAVAMEFRIDNPCDRLGPVLGPQYHVTEHLRALPHREVAGAIATVRASEAEPVVALVFEFMVLPAARWSEVRLAEWAEIDRTEGVWMVPATRMKTRREHRVPVSGRAIEVLEEARALGDGSPLVFALGDGRPIFDKRLRRLLRKLEIGAVPHGLRSNFRDWAAEETDHPREVVEAALAHVVHNKVEAAYRRSDLFERRRRVMEDWAAYLASESREP